MSTPSEPGNLEDVPQVSIISSKATTSCNKKDPKFTADPANKHKKISATMGSQEVPVTKNNRFINCYKMPGFVNITSLDDVIVNAGTTARATSAACGDTYYMHHSEDTGELVTIGISDIFDGSTDLTGLYGFDAFASNRQLFYMGGIYAADWDGSMIPMYEAACDWDFCNDFVPWKLEEQKVTCHILTQNDADGTRTCLGEYCVYSWWPESWSTGAIKTDRYSRGCFTQNSTRARGRIEVGNYSVNFGAENHINYIICAEDNCNFDLATAVASAARYQPDLPEFRLYIPDVPEEITPPPNAKTTKPGKTQKTKSTKASITTTTAEALTSEAARPVEATDMTDPDIDQQTTVNQNPPASGGLETTTQKFASFLSHSTSLILILILFPFE
ncbi:unnamed protein product, partial [Mesorhabditis spiculigera]